MCTVHNKRVHKKTYTGFKRVLVVNGKYYSPAMGIEYKIGMDLPCLGVDNVKSKKTHIHSDFCSPKQILTTCFSELLQGRTAVYMKFDDCYEDYTTGETIVKMTISGGLLYGRYNGSIIVGKHIENIELLPEGYSKKTYYLSFVKPQMLSLLNN